MTNTIEKVYHNGTEYVVKDTTYSAGTGLSLTGTTFANTGVTSVNSNTGAVTVNDVKVSASAPTGSAGSVWYDTANNQLKVHDGSGWKIVGGILLAPNTTYNVKYHRYGSQDDYDALSQYYTDTVDDTAYFTTEE